MAELENKFAIVSGGSGDVGGAIALRLAQLGADVFIAGRTQAKLDSVAEQIKQETERRVFTGQYDLRETTAPTALIDDAVAKFGALDIVVTCAGYFKRVDVASVTRSDWEEAFALMFFSAAGIVTAAWPQPKARSGGVLLNGIGPQEFTKFVGEQRSLYQRLIKEAGIPID